MSQQYLNNFITSTVLSQGYDVRYKELNKSELNKLISLAKSVLEAPSEKEVNKQNLLVLLYELTCLVENPHMGWEEKYDICWVIAGKIRNHMRVDWCDPDCGYEDDVLAYYSAVKEIIEGL